MTAWNKSPRIDMSPHSDTLSWFRANQSLIFHLNAAYIAEKQQILILKSLVWLDRASNPRSTTLEKSTLTITSRIIYVLNIWFYLCNDSFICTYNHRYVWTGPYDTPFFSRCSPTIFFFFNIDFFSMYDIYTINTIKQ